MFKADQDDPVFERKADQDEPVFEPAPPDGEAGRRFIVIVAYVLVAIVALLLINSLDWIYWGQECGRGGNIRDTEMVLVEGGTFTMGCTPEQSGSCYQDETPPRSVTVGSFFIGKYPVTNRLWNEVMGTAITSQTFGWSKFRPVEEVSWDRAQEFIDRLNQRTGRNYRLPTEAEWEYAARGGNESKGYKYSGSNNVDEVAWHGKNSGGIKYYTTRTGSQSRDTKKARMVGLKLPNELGIHDMSGNVWEWVSDRYGFYSAYETTDPVGPSSGSYRVFRGGGWGYRPEGCRVSSRGSNFQEYRAEGLGFRLARDP